MFDRFRRRPPSAASTAPRRPGAVDPPLVDPLLALVAERRAVVEGDLTAAAGSASLCALGRDGEPHPAAKYQEGRLAALIELQRGLGGNVDRRHELDRLAEVWERHLADAHHRRLGPDWSAYRAGGVDELERIEELIADLELDGP